MLIYEWTARGTRRASGVHDDKHQARKAAAAALLADPAAASALVTEAWPPATLFGRYFPTGRTWTGYRDGSRVAWTAARDYPQELAS
jgi:hypothetical protein